MIVCGTGIKEPIFASAVPAVQSTQLRCVLQEIVQSHAQNLEPSHAPLDSASLKEILRKKVAANKRRAG